MTAGDERCARCVAVSLLSLDRNSPLEVTKATPLMIVGVSGETRSRETQAGCNVGAPFCSTIFHATTAPFGAAPLLAANPVGSGPTVGARTHRAPLVSCQLANAPGSKSFPDAGEVNNAVPRFLLSSKCTRPSSVAPTISVWP